MIPTFERACDHAARTGINLVHERYDWQGLRYAFHNSAHSTDVYVATHHIVGELFDELSPEDRLLLPVSAGWHDAEHGGTFDPRDGSSEEASATQASHHMETYDGMFTTRHIDRVKEFIIGTIVELKDGEINHSIDPGDLAALALADADLCSLGMEPQLAVPRFINYFKELYGEAPSANGAFMNYLYNEIDLLKGHTFHLEVAKYLFPYAQQNAAHIRHILGNYAVQ